MKVPELYIKELVLLNQCIKTASDVIGSGFERDKKRTEREMFFRPWAKNSIAMAFAIRGQMALEILRDLREIQEKLLNSTGVDDDMQPVTLKKLLNIEE